MISIEDLDFDNYEKAIKTLKEAAEKESLSELERDGAIQRFEYTFELAWKMMRKALLALGRSEVSSSPKPVIRDAREEGLVGDVEKWFAFLEARNLSTHIYSKKEAEEAFAAAKGFLPYAEKLLHKLKGLRENGPDR